MKRGIKHLAKDVYLRRDGDYSFELLRKYFVKKEGKTKGKTAYTTLGYYSNMRKVVRALEDLGYAEWVNSDVQACRKFINEACESLQV